MFRRNHHFGKQIVAGASMNRQQNVVGMSLNQILNSCLPSQKRGSGGISAGDMVFDVELRFLVSAIHQIVTKDRDFARVSVKIFLAGCICLSTVQIGSAETKLSLTPSLAPNQGAQVTTVLDVKGDLKLNADGSRVTRLPFNARGRVVFAQRILRIAPGARRDVRQYSEASASIRVGEVDHQAELPTDRRTIVVDSDSKRGRLYSPLGPLTRDQLELIEIQGSPALLDRLLPTGDVAIGDHWSHDDQLIAQLFGLEAIQRNELRSTLRAVENETVVIDLSGNLRGAIAGVSSDIDVKAKYHFDRKRRLVRWLSMTIKENRSIGHASPGFEVTARIRVSIDPQEVPPQLHDSALAGLDLAAEPGSLLLEFTSRPGGFRFLHPRTWQVMVDRHDVSVLRMIERGDLIAQCNVSRIPNLPAGKRVALEAFQADIQRALKDEFGEFVQATQATSRDGHRVLRVVVAGQASGLPIQWRYYHISTDAGRQVSMVFTMDDKLVEKFADSDQTVISAFEFIDPAATPVPSPTLGPRREASAAPLIDDRLR